jgi:cytidine deaminase
MNRVSSIHAEDNAIRKLPSLPKNKKLKRVDILVIRVNKSGMMANSKPCIHCLMLMITRLPLKGYSLSDIYFSNADGTLSMEKLNNLLYNDEHHISRYHKDRGSKICLTKV